MSSPHDAQRQLQPPQSQHRESDLWTNSQPSHSQQQQQQQGWAPHSQSQMQSHALHSLHSPSSTLSSPFSSASGSSALMQPPSAGSDYGRSPVTSPLSSPLLPSATRSIAAPPGQFLGVGQQIVGPGSGLSPSPSPDPLDRSPSSSNSSTALGSATVSRLPALLQVVSQLHSSGAQPSFLSQLGIVFKQLHPNLFVKGELKLLVEQAAQAGLLTLSGPAGQQQVELTQSGVHIANAWKHMQQEQQQQQQPQHSNSAWPSSNSGGGGGAKQLARPTPVRRW